MSLLERKHKIETFRSPRRPLVERNHDSYRVMYSSIKTDLISLIDEYHELGLGNNIRHRWCRDQIDNAIKRYHDYCIVQDIKSHYVQQGVSLLSKHVIVEHVIPRQIVRELLLCGELTLDQALNSPICRVSRDFNKQINDAGLVKSTPDAWLFFSRYTAAATLAEITVPAFSISTYNGIPIDVSTWSLPDHYAYFGIELN